jgi:C1A family cysteine protease
MVLMILFLCLIAINFSIFNCQNFQNSRLKEENLDVDWKDDFDSYLLYREVYKKENILKENAKEIYTRYEIYRNNLAKIKEHNSNSFKNYKIGVNQFTDMTLEELSEKYLDFKIKEYVKHSKSIYDMQIFNHSSETSFLNELPEKKSNFYELKGESNYYDPIDWREKNIFLPIRDQGDCGGCWAFATVGTIEALRSKNFKINKYLSPQQLIDCDIKEKGCKGGWPSIAYNYIYTNGVVTDDDYPYIASKGSCNSSVVQTSVESRIDRKIFSCEEDECLANNFQYNLLKNGPMAVVIDAYHTNFFNYNSGYYDESCSEPNHAIILVGIGFDQIKNIQYWIIRNSWGDKWGIQGYGYVKYDNSNNWSCNINRYAFQPIVLK